MTVLTPKSVFRKYVTDGVSGSGNHNPKKAEIVQLLNAMIGGTGAIIGDFRGAWSGATAYVAGDVVESGGSLWYAKIDNTNVTPVAGVTWALFLPGATVADGTITFAKMSANTIRKKLTANLSIYVDVATGDDGTADGTVGLPFETLNAARIFVHKNYDLACLYSVTFICSGNYSVGLSASGPLVGANSPFSEVWRFVGGCVVAAPTDGVAFHALYNAKFTIEAPDALTIEAPGSSGLGVAATEGGFINIVDGVSFQDCGRASVQTSWGGTIILGGTTNYITGDAYAPFEASGGVLQINPGVTIYLMGNPTYTRAVCWAYGGAIVGFAGSTLIPAGTVTGKRYDVGPNSWLVGPGAADATAFPGTVAGTATMGGQYGAY